MITDPRPGGGSFLKSWTGLVLLGFLALAAFFLVTEHTAHFFGALPFLLVGGCLLMHVFVHGGHGGRTGPTDEHTGQQAGSSMGGTETHEHR